MSDFKVGNKVFLESKISEYDASDNTYCVDYSDYHKTPRTSHWIKDDVLHTPDDVYNKGLNDLWNLTKKIVLSEGDGGYSYEELENIFGYKNLESVLKAFTPQEALGKVKAYEEKCNKIKVGDVVKLKGDYAEGKGIVTRIDNFNIYRLFRDGSCNISSSDFINRYFEKTGEHFDSIDEFMRSAD